MDGLAEAPGVEPPRTIDSAQVDDFKKRLIRANRSNRWLRYTARTRGRVTWSHLQICS